MFTIRTTKKKRGKTLGLAAFYWKFFEILNSDKYF